jgi:putative MATE family efflux protein
MTIKPASPARAKFLDGDLMRHVAVMSFTASVGTVAIFFVDLVDMWFISLLGNASLVSAIGYSTSILFFLTSVGIGLAIAAGAFVARSLGRGEHDRARAYATNVMMFSFMLMVPLAALIWFFAPTLLSALGAKGESLSAAITYLRILVPAAPILGLGMCAGAVLRGHGDASRSMWTTVSSGLVNAALDPILIFGLSMGIEGAAWASVVSRIVTLGVGLYYIYRHYGGLNAPSIPKFKADFSPIMALAAPAVLTNIATPVGQAIVTRSMAGFGDEAVAGMTVIGRLLPVSFGVIYALSGAVGPIIGQNYGAGYFDRVRTTLYSALKFCVAYVLIASLILFLLRAPIADMFKAEGQTRELIYLFCGPLALFFMFNGILFVSNASFNNLHRPFYSTALNWGRNTIGMALPVWFLSSRFGPDGVMFGQVVGGVVFGLFGYWLALHLVNYYERKGIEGDASDLEAQTVKRGFWRALSPFSKGR